MKDGPWCLYCQYSASLIWLHRHRLFKHRWIHKRKRIWNYFHFSHSLRIVTTQPSISLEPPRAVTLRIGSSSNLVQEKAFKSSSQRKQLHRCFIFVLYYSSHFCVLFCWYDNFKPLPKNAPTFIIFSLKNLNLLSLKFLLQKTAFLLHRKLNMVVYYCQYMYTLARYVLGSGFIGWRRKPLDATDMY